MVKACTFFEGDEGAWLPRLKAEGRRDVTDSRAETGVDVHRDGGMIALA